MFAEGTPNIIGVADYAHSDLPHSGNNVESPRPARQSVLIALVVLVGEAVWWIMQIFFSRS